MEPVASHAYPGLEVQPDPAPEYARFNQAPLQSVVQPPPMHPHQHQEPMMPEWKDAQTPKTTTTPRRRILGLTVPVFWTLLVVLVVVLAGAIGGGIGGGLAAQSMSGKIPSAAAAAAEEEGAKPSATTTLQPGEEPKGTVTATTAIPIMQPSLIPRDGGCPGINGTPFVSSITLQGQNVAQTFHQRCDTNYAETEENPGLRDLYSAFATSFEECMTWCARYNEQLQQQGNDKEGRSSSGGEGWCTVVAVAKIPGGRCHLKSQGPNPLVNTTRVGEKVTAAELVDGIGRPGSRRRYAYMY